MNVDSMSPKEYFWRVLIWGGLGKLSGLQGENLAKLAFGAPIGERLLGTSLEELIVNAVEEYNKNSLRSLLKPQPDDTAQVPTATDENSSEVPVQSVAQVPTPSHHFEAKNDGTWLELIPHPSVVEILGRRGSGKSALGHRLLELSRFRSLVSWKWYIL